MNDFISEAEIGPSPAHYAIGDICDRFGGDVQTGPFGSQLHASDYSQNGTPVVMPQDMVDGRVDCKRIARVSDDHVRRLSRHVLRKGDIVFSRRGDVSRFSVITELEDGWLCGTGSIRIRLNCPDIDIRYARRYLQQQSVANWLQQNARGITMPNLNTQIIRGIPFVIPSLSEQRRIAAILDQADALRAKRRAALALLDEMAQAIFVDMFGDPLRAGADDNRVRLGELGNLDRGVSKHRPRNAPELLGGPYPFVQTGDVTNCCGYVEKYSATYSEAGLRQSKMWKAGTLCITIAANIARVAILTFDACFPDSVVGFSASDPWTTEYVRVWFSFVQNQLEDSAPESTQKNINLAILRGLPIHRPELDDRERFAKAIWQLRKVRQRLHESSLLTDELFASLQHRAFRGEL